MGDFLYFDIYERMASLRKLNSTTLIYYLKINNLNVNISEMVTALAEMQRLLTFIFTIEWHDCKNILRDLDLLLMVRNWKC